MQDVYETDRLTTAATPDVKILNPCIEYINNYILDGDVFQANGDEKCKRSYCLYRSSRKYTLQQS